MSLMSSEQSEGQGFRVPDIIAKELSRHLEEQIIFGDLPPGSRLTEEEVVRRFNVSRSPVREALRTLEQEGLVARESRRGVWVGPLTLADLDEVYTCRLAMEGLAMELAAQNRNAADLIAIRASLEKLKSMHEGKDIKGFFQANVTLSSQIHSASANVTLARLLRSIGKQSLRYRYFAYSNAPEMMKASIEGHEEIVVAMEKRSARHARTLLEDMIQRSWDVIRAFLSKVDGLA